MPIRLAAPSEYRGGENSRDALQRPRCESEALPCPETGFCGHVFLPGQMRLAPVGLT